MNKIIKIEVPPEMHAKFKAAAASNGQSIKDALTELIEYYILNPKPQLNERKD